MLQEGRSDNDLDLIIYPLNKMVQDAKKLYAALEKAALTRRCTRKSCSKDLGEKGIAGHEACGTLGV